MGKKRQAKLSRSNIVEGSGGSFGSSILPALIYICALVALVAPLLPSASASMPVTLTQAAFFQAAVALMVGLWLPLAISDRRYRPRWGAVTVSVMLFGVMMIASLPFSADPSQSFWSQLWRMTGVFNLLHYIVWFLVLSSVIRSRKDWRLFLSVSCLFALFAGLYGLKQWLASPMSASVVSTLGNQSMLAAYVLPHIFIAAYLMIGNRSWSRYFFGVVALVGTLTVIVSASRGAVLALLVGITLVAAVLAALSTWSKKRRLAIVGLLFILPSLLVGTVLLLRLPVAREAVTARIQVPRFISRVVYRDIGSDRKLLWSYAWRGFLERPVFGWGNEMFGYLYDHYFDYEAQDKIIFNERWQDRAHNQYLDILVSYGIIGMLSFLLIWLTAARKIFLDFRKTTNLIDRRRLAMLAVVLVSYLIYILTIFDTPAQLATIFALLALVATTDHDQSAATDAVAAPRIVWRLGALALLLPAALYVAWIDWAPVMRSVDTHTVLLQLRSDRTALQTGFAQAFGQPNVYADGFCYATVFETQKYMELAQLNDVVVADGLRLLANQAVASAEAHPLSSRYLIGASTALRMLAPHDPTALFEAERYAQQVIDLMPGRFDGYAELAEAAILRGDFDRALALLEQAEIRVYASRADLKSRLNMLQAAAFAGLRRYEEMGDRLQLAAEQDASAYFDARPAVTLSQTVQFGDDLTHSEKYLMSVAERYGQVPTVNRALQNINRIISSADPTSSEIEENKEDDSLPLIQSSGN
ncbi:MAG: O-antigen ligase family protein [Patescibacteria group bacterium]